MLLNLHIKNMALIDEIDINFGNHLNILTGETGTGKSIIIDSILIALGGKLPKDFVRTDAEYGLVELLFSVENEDSLSKLREFEITDLESGQIIISRKIIGNRSINKVNGENYTQARIREIASVLLDLHAQHEHQSLLIPANHMKLLDRFGHEKIMPLKQRVENSYSKYRKILEELSTLALDEEEKKRQLDLILYEKNEIEEAALKVNEDVILEEQYKIASNSKNISDGLSVTNHFVVDVASEAIDRAIREISDVAQYDAELESMQESLITVSDLLSDFGRDARNYLEQNTYSDEEFYEMENRLNTINHLKAKYGKTIESVLAYKDELDLKYERLLNQDHYIENLKSDLKTLEETLEKDCMALSNARKEIAGFLTNDIKEALVDLNFLDVRFSIEFERIKDYSANGYDYAYFLISTNIGEEMKPLWQVASGGELSRIMLAIKSCLADSDGIETLIFDEIDVGISGRTAQKVSEKISEIGKKHQVICITHLPQIAAMATQHFLIEKNVLNEKTITNIHQLNEKEEIMEIARLISGVKITDTVIQSAREMKELAGKTKVN